MKRTPLQRRSQLRSRPRTVDRNDPARVAWKVPHSGWCQCGCTPPVFALHLERHHVYPLSKLKQLGRMDQAWTLANSMLLAPQHHRWHTDHFRLIPVQFVPAAAVEFVEGLIGADASLEFFLRAYGRQVPEGEGQWTP